MNIVRVENADKSVKGSIAAINVSVKLAGSDLKTWEVYTSKICYLLEQNAYKLIVAKDREGQIIGYAAYRSDGRGSCLPISKKRPAPYLSYLAVLPEYRKQGIGRALLHEVVSQVKDIGRLYLDCRTESSMEFYRTVGMEIGSIKETSSISYCGDAPLTRVKIQLLPN